jgi:hypothetical protein
MGAMRRCLAVGASTLLLGLTTTGAATAAPLDFTPGQKYDALCDGTPTAVEPVLGDGVFTPYWVDGKTRRLLVPTSLTLTADEGLKARHLVPGTTLTKGNASSTGSVTCVITGTIRQTDVSYAFTLVVTGQLR